MNAWLGAPRAPPHNAPVTIRTVNGTGVFPNSQRGHNVRRARCAQKRQAVLLFVTRTQLNRPVYSSSRATGCVIFTAPPEFGHTSRTYIGRATS